MIFGMSAKHSHKSDLLKGIGILLLTRGDFQTHQEAIAYMKKMGFYKMRVDELKQIYKNIAEASRYKGA